MLGIKSRKERESKKIDGSHAYFSKRIGKTNTMEGLVFGKFRVIEFTFFYVC